MAGKTRYVWHKISALFSCKKGGAHQPPKVILVIEDNDVDMRIIEKSLKGLNCRILKATGAAAGLALARRKAPDLIILDCLLPEMRGEEVCRRLKTDAKTKSIPVVILTVLENNILDCYEAGATKYLSKPITPKILRLEVQDALANPTPVMDDGIDK